MKSINEDGSGESYIGIMLAPGTGEQPPLLCPLTY